MAKKKTAKRGKKAARRVSAPRRAAPPPDPDTALAPVERGEVGTFDIVDDEGHRRTVLCEGTEAAARDELERLRKLEGHRTLRIRWHPTE